MKDYFILKSAFRKLYLSGLGDFWYENDTIGDENRFFYKFCRALMFAIFIFMTVLEIMAITMGDFPDDERGDATTFFLSHTIVICKLFSVLIERNTIKDLCRRLVTACDLHEDDAVMTRKYKLIRMNVIAYVVSVYMSLVSFVFEGCRKLYFEDRHFVTIVTYWPVYDDNSISALALRIFWTLTLTYMMMPMIVVDGLAVTLMITLKYKFITLRNYFEKLKEDFNHMKNTVSNEEMSEYLHKACVEGIVMHQQLLITTKELHKSFGFVIAMQICLSIFSDISLLLTLMLTPNLTFTTALKIVFFILALLFLLAVFLCNAGEITYQASLLADTIYFCGWHTWPKTTSSCKIGSMVLFTCAVAQKPLVMKAFKMLDLTYGTFLTVVRFMYSVFALIYARQEETK